MSIKTNELQQLMSVQGTDSILADSAAGTGRVPFSTAAQFFDQELVKPGSAVGAALENKAAADFSNLPSPQTALYNLGAGTGRDLLDNPLFQINQRNITAAEYTGSVIRTVDRWEAWRYDVEVTSNGISIAEHTEGSAGWFRQMLDIPLMGKDVTFSAIIDGELHSVTALSFKSDIYSEWKDNARLSIGYSGQTGLYSAAIYNNTAVKKVIQATKLELGSQQTLAHQDAAGNWVLNDPPPDKTLELAKCQRYLIYGELDGSKVWNNSDRSGGFFIPLPTEMRANPTLIGSVKYYKQASGLEDPPASTEFVFVKMVNGIYAYLHIPDGSVAVRDTYGIYIDNRSGFSAEL